MIYFLTRHLSLATLLQELLSYSDGEVGPGTVQECRSKSASLLSFIWTNKDDLVLVTDHGIEFYQVMGYYGDFSILLFTVIFLLFSMRKEYH